MKLAVPIALGSIIVADHLKFTSRDEAVVGRNYALGIMDRYAGWSDGFPSVCKSAEKHTPQLFYNFVLPVTKLKIVGLITPLSLSPHVVRWVTDITLPLRIGHNPMESPNATCV